MYRLKECALAGLLVAALPLGAVAQEAAAPEADPQGACSAEITPITAVAQAQATATFDAPFGVVTAIKGPEKSGLKLVKEVEPERAEMAAEPAAPADEGVELAQNTATFRVDASRTEPGIYDVTLENEAGESCSGTLTVRELPEPGEGT